MARSNNKNIRNETAFLYERLSRDDALDGDSYSIANQKKLLAKVANEKGYTKVVHFCDDGVSGVTMQRPAFIEMIKQLELGKASAVFVKDLSRLGRNYIEVGKLTEEFFPEHNIRFVAVSDNIDSFEGENELAPIKNLFNEWYARDISKKRRISNKIKGSSGEPLGPPPYGYLKNPEDPKKWVIDEEAAMVVRKIASLILDGKGIDQVAVLLTEEKILPPMEYALSKGYKRPGKRTNPNPYHWTHASILKIITNQEYCGDVVNFKTYSKSYKNKKRIKNDPENIMVFKDVNPAILDRETFEKIQKQRGTVRRRQGVNSEGNIFSGLLKCADCGSNMHFHFNQANPSIKYFCCSGYNRGKRKICTSTHYIRVDFLESVILYEIKRLTKFACHHEEAFTTAVSDYTKKAMQTEQKIRQNELKSLMARDKEIDVLFEKIYEDNALGKITDERFQKLTSKYDEEQIYISNRIDELNKEYNEHNQLVANTEVFLSAIKKYTRIKKLTPRILNELVDHIEVHHAETVDGKQTQRIDIFYNCIGSVEIPKEIEIPIPQITLQTRKGVDVTYVSALDHCG